MNQIIAELLGEIYGDEMAREIMPRLDALLAGYQSQIAPNSQSSYFNEKDVILITYGDMVQEEGERQLATLHHFLDRQVSGLIQGVHLLPFFPYSSDDGFSVIDYDQVDPNLGSWSDVEMMGESFKLMFDAVINHISQESDWFQAYLRGETPYIDYFIEVDPEIDLTTVFRPRALPLLTPVNTSRGDKYVWTTFSEDQIDLNFRSPDLLLEILRVLLNYVAHGAELIRLDAIAFMWKEYGTNCLHRPQTHALIQLMRAVLDEAAPYVVLITETNVPHVENISYFGDGHNEAQMVYNFSLPPLTLHAFHTGNAETLSRWAATLTQLSDETTFFNFLASHDGIGLTPARGLLSDEHIVAIAERVKILGGHVSYRNNADGSKSAYELNINYLEALSDPAIPEENVDLVAQRFICSQAIMLALRGVPGIYFHSLFGSKNWHEGVRQSGRSRSINREKLQRIELERELADETSLRHKVFNSYGRLLKARRDEPAFHPNGKQTVLAFHPSVFAIRRATTDEESSVLCLHNVSDQTVQLIVPQLEVRANFVTDLLSGSSYSCSKDLALDLTPFQILWLKG